MPAVTPRSGVGRRADGENQRRGEECRGEAHWIFISEEARPLKPIDPASSPLPRAGHGSRRKSRAARSRRPPQLPSCAAPGSPRTASGGRARPAVGGADRACRWRPGRGSRHIPERRRLHSDTLPRRDRRRPRSGRRVGQVDPNHPSRRTTGRLRIYRRAAAQVFTNRLRDLWIEREKQARLRLERFRWHQRNCRPRALTAL